MAQSLRQSELFAAEEWQTIYRAFSDINFNAFDFDTIKDSMIGYLRFNFPEDFNDWIESSEFVALIDLIAYLGQITAFRMDLNSQENFIDVVERKESILRMARMLSYVPSRNLPARGLAKITSIQTSEPLVDSLGNNLQNVIVDWNDPSNPDWFEQFILILNSSFTSTNPYGTPTKNGTISNIPTDLYQINTSPVNTGQYGFSANVNDEALPFEVVNPDFNTTIFERTPNPLYSMHLVHRNDGNGNSSSNSGFFVFIKQGTLNFEDFQIDVPIENRVININDNNINQLDVWVQNINDDGSVIKTWNQVPAVVGNNVVFNSFTRSITDIYSVITRNNDQISLRFADGVFGSVPTGLLRVYYRTSANSTFSVDTKDVRNKQVSIPYVNSNNKQYALTVTFSLQESIQNAQTTESLEQIRLRAPQVYYTQNRMVNGEDYNVFPLQSSEILKLKAINREYSGQSRFLDINSPTSTFQDTNVFADDGILYREYDNGYVEIPLSANKTSGEIVSTTLFTLLTDIELRQFVYDQYPNFSFDEDTPRTLWQQATQGKFSSTGQFISGTGIDSDDIEPNLGKTPLSTSTVLVDYSTTDVTRPENYITEGALVEFRFGAGSASKWATIETVDSNGNGFFDSGKGRITINEPIQTNDQLVRIYVSFRTTLTSAETTTIKDQIDDQNSFGLRFDHFAQSWKIITAPNLAPIAQDFSLTYAGDLTLTNRDASWLVRFDFNTDRWQITSRGLKYIYESEQDVRFFINQFVDVSSSISGRSARDTIQILETESKPGSTSVGFGERLVWGIKDVFRYPDGFQEPRRIVIGFNDSDDDGVPDDPELFVKAVLRDPSGDTITEASQYIYHERITDQFGYDNFEFAPDIYTTTDIDTNPPNTVLLSNGAIVYDLSDETFYVFDEDTVSFSVASDQSKYQANIGRKNLDFLWKHIVDKTQRIDPAIGNVIDMFVLTNAYDIAYRRWLATNSLTSAEPAAPTSESLKVAFSNFESYKMVSDEMIWRPVKYRPLFGQLSPEELRAKFKVIKLNSTEASDGEIKSQLIQAINEYFSINNFDFGDTFYASELIAYIHLRMPTMIAGVQLVPQNEESVFGNLQEIKSESDEIFISAATVSDVEIVKAFTASVLRVGN